MKYKIKKEVLWKLVEGEAVIINNDSDSYCYLNRTGTDIWRMIDMDYPIEKIEQIFIEKYEVPLINAKEDISEIVKKLIDNKLIEEIE